MERNLVNRAQTAMLFQDELPPASPVVGSGIRDNHRRGSVADFLRQKIRDGSRLSVVSAYFTIYAYEALKDSLDRIERLRFLFGEPRFIKSLDPDRDEKKYFEIAGDALKLANQLSQIRICPGMRRVDRMQGRNPLRQAHQLPPREDVLHRMRRVGGRHCRQLQLHCAGARAFQHPK